MNKKNRYNLSDAEISYIIEMAWMDDVSYEAIRLQFGLLEKEVISIMRRNLKRSSFILWRKRVTSQVSKKQRNKIDSKIARTTIFE